jgi:hypothetical protein
MTHDDLGGVRISTAAKMLEYGKSTIRRKIKDGDLETFGSGSGLRVSLRSIRAYQNGERGKWRKSESQASELNMDRGVSTQLRTVVSSSRSESKKVKSPYAGVQLRARKPTV